MSKIESAVDSILDEGDYVPPEKIKVGEFYDDYKTGFPYEVIYILDNRIILQNAYDKTDKIDVSFEEWGEEIEPHKDWEIQEGAKVHRFNRNFAV